ALMLAAMPFYAAEVPANHDAFETRVRPVLARACFSCHTDSAMGGLKMDSREHILKDVVPGDPDASKLVQAIRYSGARKMPPSGKLKDEEIASIEAWVKAGAVWPESVKQRDFWAFRPIASPAVPEVANKKWAQT